MTDSATPGTGAVTFDDAVASLLPPEPETTEQEAPEAPAGAEEPAQESEAETTPAEDAPSEAEEPGDGGEEAEAVEPESPVVEAPAWWPAEAKAKFKDLTPDLQAVVHEQEKTRERLVSEAKERASNAEKQRDEELKGVRTLAEQLNTFLPEALQTFQQRWGAQEPDWAQVAEQYGAGEAFKIKARFETEEKQLQQLALANQQAQTKAHEEFVRTEWKALAEISPELAPDAADPRKGSDLRQKVTAYLIDRGIPKDAIARISAVEMALAHDAMRWREAQSAIKTAPKPKPQPAAPRAPVRPAAAAAQPSPQRAAQQVANRFAQTRSVDDAVALLLARNG